MTRTILSLVLLASTASAQSRWTELKTGDQVAQCFATKAAQIAAPLFGRWISQPRFNPQGNVFEASWRDSVGGSGALRLETGAPPAMIQCQLVRGKSSFSKADVTGIVCASMMANGTVMAELTRNVQLSQGQTAMSEEVPVMALQGNRLFCTN
ncbi:MAG: hypothetical protein ABL958_14485 [Bdellovibrionia bacterium]